MRKLFGTLFVAIAAMCVLNSCSQEETDGLRVEQANGPSSMMSKMTKEDVRDMLLTKGILNTLQHDLYSKIQEQVESGNDEKISLKDFLKDNQIKAKFCDAITRTMPRKAASVTGTENNSVDKMVDSLSNSGVSVYWPYSENWDGEEAATVVVAPDDEDAVVCDGYTISSTGNSVIYNDEIDEDFAMEHPVLVISDNANDDEMTNLYGNTNDTIPSKATETSGTQSASVYVDVWRLVSMQVTHQYDSWLAGGSEIDIQIVTPTGTGYAVGTTKYRVKFTRSEIGKKTWKNINLPLNTNWREEQLTNYILITESDGGTDISIPVSVDYKDKDADTTIKLSTTLHFKSHDEQIGQLIVDRNYMLKYGTLSFDNSNVNLKAPIVHE